MFWTFATEAEVYSLNAALIGTMLHFVSRHLERREEGSGDRHALVLALSTWIFAFSNHLTVVCMAPAFAVLVVLHARDAGVKSAAKLFLAPFVTGLVVLALYAYVPLRLHAHTPYTRDGRSGHGQHALGLRYRAPVQRRLLVSVAGDRRHAPAARGARRARAPVDLALVHRRRLGPAGARAEEPARLRLPRAGDHRLPLLPAHLPHRRHRRLLHPAHRRRRGALRRRGANLRRRGARERRCSCRCCERGGCRW